MPTRLDCLVVDAADPSALARFWSEALRWPITFEEPDEVVLEVEDEPWVPMIFGAGADPKTVKNRLHLDLASSSLEHQTAEVARLTALGATAADVGQGDDVPWVVLTDPEGNELCVLEPRDTYVDTGPVAAIVLHCVDPPALADFWAAALDWPVVTRSEPLAALRRPDGRGPFIELITSPAPKTVKNRLHLDVAPHKDDDHGAEVARLEGLGARRVDIGQGEVKWVVLADPEGNEFCVLTPR